MDTKFVRIGSFLLTMVTVLFAGSSPAADRGYNPDYFKNPPRASRAYFDVLTQPTAGGNAVLRIEYANKQRQNAIVIRGTQGPTTLRDDGQYPDTQHGDGVYAALVTINLEQHFREQQRRTELARQIKEVPIFSMRQLLGYQPFRPSPPKIWKPGDRGVIDDFLGIPMTVDPAKELMITHPSVVEDPDRTYDACTGEGTQLGAWTFGRLMTEIANEPVTGIRPGDFVEHWIEQWMSDLTINTFTVFNRQVGAQRLIDNWPRLPDGQLDLGQAPFRLLAIVNRIDLRENFAYGGGGAGEARLIFAALNCNGEFSNGGMVTNDSVAFNVIFEYGVPITGCPAVKSWAQQWHALGGLALGSVAYNDALQDITDQFTLRDTNLNKLPNRSSINQIRTNEFAFKGAETFWELRESRLNACNKFCLAGAGLLEHKTVAQTPHHTYQSSVPGRALLTTYIDANETEILDGTHNVTLTLPTGERFRGGNAEPGAGFAWNPGMVDLEARHQFSKATCSGCHTREVDADFVHVAARDVGDASELSDFLTGLNMPKLDPVSGAMRHFNELLDRQQKLDATAHMTCFKVFDFPVEEIFVRPVPPAFAH